MEVVVTAGAIGRAKLHSNHYRQQTNTRLFLQAGCPSCRPTNSVKALKGKISYSMDYYHHITPSSPGGLPALSLTTNSSWLPWGRFAMPRISPLTPVPQITSDHLNQVIRTRSRSEPVSWLPRWWRSFQFREDQTPGTERDATFQLGCVWWLTAAERYHWSYDHTALQTQHTTSSTLCPGKSNPLDNVR